LLVGARLAEFVRFVHHLPTEEFRKLGVNAVQLLNVVRHQGFGHKDNQDLLELLGPNLHAHELLLLLEHFDLVVEVVFVDFLVNFEFGMRELQRRL